METVFEITHLMTETSGVSSIWDHPILQVALDKYPWLGLEVVVGLGCIDDTDGIDDIFRTFAVLVLGVILSEHDSQIGFLGVNCKVCIAPLVHCLTSIWWSTQEGMCPSQRGYAQWVKNVEHWMYDGREDLHNRLRWRNICLLSPCIIHDLQAWSLLWRGVSRQRRKKWVWHTNKEMGLWVSQM